MGGKIGTQLLWWRADNSLVPAAALAAKEHDMHRYTAEDIAHAETKAAEWTKKSDACPAGTATRNWAMSQAKKWEATAERIRQVLPLVQADDGADEPDLCARCNGSGEGLYEGTRCMECSGSGRAIRPK